MNTTVRWLIAAMAALFLAACGGGGGGSSTSDNSWLSFTPASIRVNATEGVSANFNVLATSSKTIAQTLYIVVVDNGGVIMPSATRITAQSQTSYLASFVLSPNLAPKTYESSLTVKLCTDSTACNSPYPGSPWTVPYVITVQPVKLAITSSSALNFGYIEDKPALNTLSFNVTASSTEAWSVQSKPTWLNLDKTSGTGPAVINVSANQSLRQGRYTDNIVISGSSGSTATIASTLAIAPPSFVLGQSALAFSAVNGSTIAARGVTVDLDNNKTLSWTASSTAPWLVVASANTNSPMSVGVAIDAATPKLASGSYNGQIIFTAPGTITKTLDVSLNLVPPTLTSSATSLTLGGFNGRDISAKSITFTLNTGNPFPWKVVNPSPWISISPSGTLGTQTSVTLQASPTLFNQITLSQTLSVVATVNGDVITKTIDVNLNLDQRKLLLFETGVALSSTPNWARLTRTITLRDNYANSPTPIAWTAQSDKSWLTVTPSGSTNASGQSSISLQADPATIPTNTFAIANVTITPGDPAITSSEKLVVGLWRGASNLTTITAVTSTYTLLVNDPVRPYVYANYGGTKVDVYNMYTAKLVRTITTPFTVVKNITVAQNGSALYFQNVGGPTLGAVDLSSDALLFNANVTTTDTSGGFAWIRPNGVELLYAGSTNLKAFSPRTGAVVTPPDSSPYGSWSSVVATPDATRVMFNGATYGLDLAFGKLTTTLTLGSSLGMSGGSEAALSRDGKTAYTATGYCGKYRPDQANSYGQLAGASSIIGVKVASDGKIYCSAFSWYGVTDLWMYDPNEVILKTFKLSGYAKTILERQFVPSGDGLMGAALTDDPKLFFVPLGP